MAERPDILSIGAVLWDIIARTPRAMERGADMPGRIVRLPGGVALNIAMTAARFGLRPAVLTAIGRDPEGDELVAACEGLGIGCAHAWRAAGQPTDRYLAIEDPGGLVAAVADAHTLEGAGEAILLPLSDGRLGSQDRPWRGPIALDGNLTAGLLATIAASPLFRAADLRVAPASPGKALRLAPILPMANAMLYVNLAEAALLADAQPADAPEAAEALLARGAQRVLVTDGAREAADGCAGRGVISARPPAVSIARVTGAGDTLMAAHLAAERAGRDRAEALSAALAAAARYVSGEDCT
ncbi:MAG: bifunctional hydroxymethylpyrimidine kinase/phosphomethylpyrimidine kinase [Proteobacteria bacterium]|nr:bifunctional hydroxymethylpyrimidine kinase/phosphomethylpyrimidine kinase [Pseudomonadota bacterium]MBS0571906.1 bifunctional hydroxymethylpyrimidine kinase/phosphomethylpyrimidine kinase [Pseudomonadota bacterium]